METSIVNIQTKMNKPLIYILAVIIIFIAIVIIVKKNKNSGHNNSKEGFCNGMGGMGCMMHGSGCMCGCNSMYNSETGLGAAKGALIDGLLTNHSDAPWTIDKPTKLIITDILRKILNEINNQTGMSYYMLGYDQLKQDILSSNETRFTADIFVHEMKNLITRRMLIIFTVNFLDKTTKVDHINLSNAFLNPPKTFMDEPAPALILQDDNLLSGEYQIMGRNNSALDFSILKGLETLPREVPTPPEFQKWILPMGIHHAYQNPQAMFPSRRQSTCWDNNGVNYIESGGYGKTGVKNTPQVRKPYPYFNPTVNRAREYDTQYKWMFDLADSHGGFGRGVAGSP